MKPFICKYAMSCKNIYLQEFTKYLYNSNLEATTGIIQNQLSIDSMSLATLTSSTFTEAGTDPTRDEATDR
jgi:hypothetical protein